MSNASNPPITKSFQSKLPDSFISAPATFQKGIEYYNPTHGEKNARTHN